MRICLAASQTTPEAGRPRKHHSADILHGSMVVGTNAYAMAIPGYVSQFTVTFPQAGEYLIACNEYCGTGWKLLHTVTTYAALYPSFVTAFTVIASLEVAGRMKGATGLFDWIGRLPWTEPFFRSLRPVDGRRGPPDRGGLRLAAGPPPFNPALRLPAHQAALRAGKAGIKG